MIGWEFPQGLLWSTFWATVFVASTTHRLTRPDAELILVADGTCLKGANSLHWGGSLYWYWKSGLWGIWKYREVNTPSRWIMCHILGGRALTEEINKIHSHVAYIASFDRSRHILLLCEIFGIFDKIWLAGSIPYLFGIYDPNFTQLHSVVFSNLREPHNSCWKAPITECLSSNLRWMLNSVKRA